MIGTSKCNRGAAGGFSRLNPHFGDIPVHQCIKMCRLLNYSCTQIRKNTILTRYSFSGEDIEVSGLLSTFELFFTCREQWRRASGKDFTDKSVRNALEAI